MIRKTHPLKLGKLVFFCLSLLILGCSVASGQPAKGKQPKQPKLIVGIVVDQMRYDYIARYWDNFGEGGFKRLIAEGTTFSNCNYNYVPTETAPGHASIFTGTTPSGHGIIMNDWYDQSTIAAGVVRPHSSVMDSLYPFLGIHPLRSRGLGASPLLLDATTIADQLKAATKGKAKTIGVSLKDRSAILPVGKTADAAFWLDDITGYMISSTYYPAMKKGFPAWVDSINKTQWPLKCLVAPAGWELLLPPSKYSAQDQPGDSLYEGTYRLGESTTFPHRFTVDPLLPCVDFKTTPWGNELVKDFAKQTVIHYQMGMDKVTDFLSVSFSSTDMVAHQFGPQSREVEDTYLRLDRDLADFLSFLDARIGKRNVMVFLTADHGGAPNPTYAMAHGEKGGWIDPIEMHNLLRNKLGDKAGQDSLLTSVKGHTVYLNHALIQKRGMSLDSLAQIVADAATGFPGIEKTFTARQVAAMQPANLGETLLQNGYYASRSGDVLMLASYGYMQAAYNPRDPGRYKKGTSHGTHYAYDTHVPLLCWGWNVPVLKSDASVVIPDIAATVCKNLGIAPTSKCSGKAITDLSVKSK